MELDTKDHTISEMSHMRPSARKKEHREIEIAIIGENQTFGHEYMYYPMKTKFRAVAEAKGTVM